MSTKQGYLKERGTNNPFAPKTIDTLVKDSARNQALSASLANMVERNALGFPVFNTTADYSEGDKVFYDRRLWTTKAGGHAAGAWSDNDFDEFTFKEYLDAVASTKANTDGFYESMGVGTAVNLAGQIERTNDMTYRTSGGTEDIATGTARIEKISGNTVVWNQLAQYSNALFSANNGTLTISGTELTYISNNTDNIHSILSKQFNVPNQHILFAVGLVKFSRYLPATEKEYNGIRPSGVPVVDIIYQPVTQIDTFQKSYVFAKINGTSVLQFRVGYTTEKTDIYIKNFMFFDLTLIYGAGNEPDTPEQFEADYQQWFGKPLTYEPYNAGELIPVKMTGLKTIGFNQWDEEWRNGYYDNNTGEFGIFSSYVANKNPIKVLPNKTYYIKNPTAPLGIYVSLYDGSMKYVGYLNVLNTLTIPENVKYINFRFQAGYGTTYKNDICINLHWSGTKDGTYEPYEEHILPFDVTTLQGKLNGQGELVTPFADGLKKAGSVQDEIYYVGNKVFGVKRVGSVDLGSLTWEIDQTKTYNSFFNKGKLPNCKNPSATTIIGNCVCSKYVITAQYKWGIEDKYIALRTTMNLVITDSSYTDATTFKTAMSGVMAYYELETPLVYELEDVELPARFKVNDWGTEEQLHAEGVNSAPAILSVLYGVNAVDALRRLPQNYVTISADNNDNQGTTMRKLLNALSTAMGGTWAITVNENDPTDFDFAFTPNATPEETNTNTEGE